MTRQLLEKERLFKKNYQELLNDAIMRQDLAEITRICHYALIKKYTLDFQTKVGFTPLTLAFHYSIEVVELLLKCGADPSYRHKGIDTVNYATYLGRLDVIKALKNYGVDIKLICHDQYNPLFTSLNNKKFGLFDWFFDNGAEFSKVGQPKLNILSHYVKYGDFEIIKHIISNDKMRLYLTDFDKNSALRFSLEQNKYAIFAYLLYEGVKINETDIIGQNQVIQDLYYLFCNDAYLSDINYLKTQDPEYFEQLFNELFTQLSDNTKTTIELQLFISTFVQEVIMAIEKHNAELDALILETWKSDERPVLSNLSDIHPQLLKRGLSDVSTGEENSDPQSPNRLTAKDLAEDSNAKRSRVLSFDGTDEESAELFFSYDELEQDAHWLDLFEKEKGNGITGIEI